MDEAVARGRRVHARREQPVDMNNQPYDVPTKHWPPKLTYWWFRCARNWRRRAIAQQKFEKIEVQGLEHLAEALRAGQGVLITPNHSFHWDSYCLLEASDRLGTPFYIMTAWQVFEQSSWFDRESMQRCGCFSVDREGTDMTAMKTAVDVLQKRREPLVVFPEGDVYHTNDRVTPLRDGAAALALMAARKSERPIVVLPTAIKRWYVEDPTPSMLKTTEQLERRLFWRPTPHKSLVERILHLAEGVLALKELERFGTSRQGPLPERIASLAEAILRNAEVRYGLSGARALLPERIKEVRRRIIQLRREPDASASLADHKQWADDMDDMFLATQLYSYPGDYLVGDPSWERMAETLDKLEEDVLGARYPSVRGAMHVCVRFGSPLALPPGKEKKKSASELTVEMQRSIQSMLDKMNPRTLGRKLEPEPDPVTLASKEDECSY
jgi:hypothetical protein